MNADVKLNLSGSKGVNPASIPGIAASASSVDRDTTKRPFLSRA